MRSKRSGIVLLALALSAVLMASSQVYAVCDVGQGRVVHAESTPIDVSTTPTMIYWIAIGAPAPTLYFVFTTSNQTFINSLDAAHAGNLQVRVRGNAAVCGAVVGAFRAGGTILTVFRDSFF